VSSGYAVALIGVAGTLAGTALGASFSVAIARRDHARRKRDRLLLLHVELDQLSAEIRLQVGVGVDYSNIKRLPVVPQVSRRAMDSAADFIVPESEIVDHLLLVDSVLTQLAAVCDELRRDDVQKPMLTARVDRLQAVLKQHVPGYSREDADELSDVTLLRIGMEVSRAVLLEMVARGDSEVVKLVHDLQERTYALVQFLIADIQADIARVVRRPLPHVLPSFDPDEAAPPGWG
jgi:hypothetical protein